MRLDKLIEAVLIAALVAFSASYAHAQEFFARLNGFEEIGAQNNESGAVLSNGSGTLRLSLDKHAGTATFTLTYSDVGTTPAKTGTVSQAHIHFGKRHVAGGVMVFFCATSPVIGPAGTPVCPANSGTVTGTFTGASVVGPTAQNVTPGDFNALVDALESNTAYANIHTVAGFPAGEIRGQVRKGNGHDNDNKDHDR